MEYLKTYESFNIGGDVWVITTADEQYMYVGHKNLYDVNKNGIWKTILAFSPTEEVDWDTFKKINHTSTDLANNDLKYLIEDTGRDYMILFKDGRKFHLSEDEVSNLKITRLFMGAMKPEYDL